VEENSSGFAGIPGQGSMLFCDNVVAWKYPWIKCDLKCLDKHRECVPSPITLPLTSIYVHANPRASP
jgi:hypothetical protein